MSHQSSITVAELAHRLGATFAGDGTGVIRAVATLEQAGPDTLSWVGAPDHMARASRSKAGVLLIPKDCAPPSDRTVIRVGDPDAALCEVLAFLAPPANRVAEGVHPTATVSPEADVAGVAVGAHVSVGAGTVIGAGTQLHPGAYVGADVKIGRDCVLWPNVVVRERVRLGDGVVLHPNVTIGADGFGYLQRDGRNRKIPQIGTVVIEDDVEIGANSAVDRARCGATRIGRGTKIDNLVQIGHNVEIGEDCILAGGCAMGGSSSLGHHVVLAGHTGIGDHQHVGNGARVAAMSTVLHDIPAGRVVRGTPAIDHHRFLRKEAAVRKLPKWIEKVRDLIQRLERLEKQAEERTPE